MRSALCKERQPAGEGGRLAIRLRLTALLLFMAAERSRATKRETLLPSIPSPKIYLSRRLKRRGAQVKCRLFSVGTPDRQFGMRAEKEPCRQRVDLDRRECALECSAHVSALRSKRSSAGLEENKERGGSDGLEV